MLTFKLNSKSSVLTASTFSWPIVLSSNNSVSCGSHMWHLARPETTKEMRKAKKREGISIRIITDIDNIGLRKLSIYLQMRAEQQKDEVKRYPQHYMLHSNLDLTMVRLRANIAMTLSPAKPDGHNPQQAASFRAPSCPQHISLDTAVPILQEGNLHLDSWSSYAY